MPRGVLPELRLADRGQPDANHAAGGRGDSRPAGAGAARVRLRLQHPDCRYRGNRCRHRERADRSRRAPRREVRPAAGPDGSGAEVWCGTLARAYRLGARPRPWHAHPARPGRPAAGLRPHGGNRQGAAGDAVGGSVRRGRQCASGDAAAVHLGTGDGLPGEADARRARAPQPNRWARVARCHSARVGFSRRQHCGERVHAWLRVPERPDPVVESVDLSRAGAVRAQRRNEQADFRLGTLHGGRARACAGAGRRLEGRTDARNARGADRASGRVSDRLPRSALRARVPRPDCGGGREGDRGRRQSRPSDNRRGESLLQAAGLQGRVRGRAAAHATRVPRRSSGALRLGL